MTGRKQTGSAREYLKITLEEVRVVSYVSNGSSGDGGAPMDTASLRFGKIEVEYNTVKVSFDIAKNAGK